MPRISVILPTYNRAKFLERSIASLLNQTYQDFEIIIVDDASIDSTSEIVERLSNPKISYIRHSENKGAAAARNTGIRNANGKYIGFQDSDDEWLPNKLSKQMDVFENSTNRVGVVYCGTWLIRKNKKKYIMLPNRKIYEGDIYSNLFRINFVDTPASVVRKECFEKAGLFDESLEGACCEDWELWLRISKSYEFRYINEPLLNSYYTHPNINEQRNLIEVKTIKLILKKHQDFFADNRKLIPLYFFRIGTLLIPSTRFNEGRDYLRKAIHLQPLNLKFKLALFLSFFIRKRYLSYILLLKKIKSQIRYALST